MKRLHAIGLTSALRSSLEELRQSRERMVEAQEKERRRIQRDLHDGLGPTLASIRLRPEGSLAKHAGTAEAEVRLRRGNGWLVLNVNDDGAGFSRNGTGSGTGVGSMRERAELLDGALRLDTAPGAGTSIEVRIPVAKVGT